MNVHQIRDNTNGISLDRLRAFAPAVFAEAKHTKTSDKYRFIPTFNVVQALQEQKWVPVMAQVQAIRDGSRNGFQKHLVKFQPAAEVGKRERLIAENRAAGMRDPLHPEGWRAQGGYGVVPELVLTNAHDGSSAYVLRAGMFRLVCLNGLVVSEAQFASIHVAHRGGMQVVNEVVDGSQKLIEQLPRMVEKVGEYKAIQLDRPEQEAFAAAALVARYGQEEVAKREMDGRSLLHVWREADRDNTLWNTMNRVQENLVKGRVRVDQLTPVPEGQKDLRDRARLRVRAVKGIDTDIKLNQALWALTEKLAEVKKQAA